MIADESADPDLVAIDLLGQAEHGPDSPAWLITTSEAFGRAVIERVEKRLQTLPTREMAEPAWRNLGEVVVVPDDDAAIALSDEYAPEHLEVQTRRNDYYLSRLRNYGSLFVGEESTVAYGDKGVGTNHTLPTGRAARYTGGLWVGKFIKTVTYQRLTPEASRALAPVMARMCEAEGMIAHAATCDVRFARYAPPEREADAVRRRLDDLLSRRNTRWLGYTRPAWPARRRRTRRLCSERRLPDPRRRREPADRHGQWTLPEYANGMGDFLVGLLDKEKNPLKYIVITHFHYDHTGNAALLKKRYGAQVVAHPLDRPIIEDPMIVTRPGQSHAFRNNAGRGSGRFQPSSRARASDSPIRRSSAGIGISPSRSTSKSTTATRSTSAG